MTDAGPVAGAVTTPLILQHPAYTTSPQGSPHILYVQHKDDATNVCQRQSNVRQIPGHEDSAWRTNQQRQPPVKVYIHKAF